MESIAVCFLCSFFNPADQRGDATRLDEHGSDDIAVDR
jgi:hypothetical protein